MIYHVCVAMYRPLFSIVCMLFAVFFVFMAGDFEFFMYYLLSIVCCSCVIIRLFYVGMNDYWLFIGCYLLVAAIIFLPCVFLLLLMPCFVLLLFSTTSCNMSILAFISVFNIVLTNHHADGADPEYCLS